MDTNVLIDCLRKNQAAVTFVVSRLEDVAVSSLTIAELYQGVREGEERIELSKLQRPLSVLPVTEDIAEMGGLYARQFRASHGSGLIDYLIAATAGHHGLRLVTLNAKHFPMLDDVEVPYAQA